ncbi:hypothetical protein ACQP2T_17325 [Nonomuraea sp. CA-143628]|uniref:RNA polymerase sigma factor n=1 Tax=Nonomuraea sp. CA-143628 TaxID=3239997 RepID=UPI003D94003A
MMWRTLTDDVREEIRELCDEYGSHLYDYCRTELAQSEAELAVAGALLSAYGHTHRVVDSSLVRPWLYGLARAHRAAVAGPASIGSWSRSGRMPDLLPEALRALDGPQRELLDLSVRHGLAHQEIAVIFDVTPPDVDVIVSEAARGVERWFSAVIAARSANGCGQLAAKVSAWATTPTRRNRARISRHIPTCPTCRAAPRAVVAATLLRELPIATAPPTLRDRLTWAQPLPDAGELWRVDGFPVQVRGLVEAAPMLISPIADPTAAIRGSAWPAAGAAAAGQERKPHRSHRAPTTTPPRSSTPASAPLHSGASAYSTPAADPPRSDASTAIPHQRSDPDALSAALEHETTIPLARKPAAGPLPRRAPATGPSAHGLLAAPVCEAPAAPPRDVPASRPPVGDARLGGSALSERVSPPPGRVAPPAEPVSSPPGRVSSPAEPVSSPPEPVLRLPGLVIGGPPVPSAPVGDPPMRDASNGQAPLDRSNGQASPDTSNGHVRPDASDRGPAGAGPRGRHPFGDRQRDVLVATARDRQGVFVAASGTRRDTPATRSRPAPSAPGSRRDATTTSPHRDATVPGNRRGAPDTHRDAQTATGEAHRNGQLTTADTGRNGQLATTGTGRNGQFATTGTRPGAQSATPTTDTLIAGTQRDALVTAPGTRHDAPFPATDAYADTHAGTQADARAEALFTTAATLRDALIMATGEHRDLLVATQSTDSDAEDGPGSEFWRNGQDDQQTEFWRNRPGEYESDGRFSIRSIATVGLLVGAGMLVASLAWSGIQSRHQPEVPEPQTKLSGPGSAPAVPPGSGSTPNLMLNPTVVPPPTDVPAAPTANPDSKMSDTVTGEVRPQKVSLPGPRPPVARLSPSSLNLGTRRTGSFGLVCPGSCKITTVSGTKGIAVSAHAFRVQAPASRPGCPGPPATEFGKVTVRWTGTSSGDGQSTTGLVRGSGTLTLRVSWTVANAKGSYVSDGKGGGYWTNCGGPATGGEGAQHQPPPGSG